MSARLRPKPNPSEILGKALLRVADHFAWSGKQLAQFLGMSEASISRLMREPERILPESREGETALLLIRLYRSLDILVGGDQKKAQLWLKHENIHLGGVPEDRIKSIEGLVDVVHYLDAMRAPV